MKRLLCLIMGIGLWSGAFCAADCRQVLTDSLRTLLADRRAEVGVAAVLDDGSAFTYGNDRRYPMLSVFKFHLALAVLHRLDSLRQPLTLPLDVSAADLRPDTWSPLRDRYPRGGVRLSVGDLLLYSLQQSDNVACDALFRRFGAPARVEAYVRSLGFPGFHIGVTEAEMHDEPARAVANRSTPVDVARLFYGFTEGRWLSPGAQAFVSDALLGCSTGTDRLPAGLAGTGARIGHKTGTGFRDAAGRMQGFNDAGFVLLPDGRRYAMAVFIDDALATDAECAALMARLSALVCRAFSAAPAATGR